MFEVGGIAALKQHEFFKKLDWTLLEKKQLVPPLAPDLLDGTYRLPVTDGSAETWDRDRADPLFATFIEDRTDDITDAQCTASGLAGRR